MYNPFPEAIDNKEYELRNHVGDPKNKILTPEDDIMLPESSILHIESLAGIYRSYYELVKISDEYKDKVHIVIVADGYDKLTEDFLKRCEKAAIYNEFCTQNWRTVEGDPGSKDPKHTTLPLLKVQ